jgi:GntP family gluconate:H+ symporter
MLAILVFSLLIPLSHESLIQCIMIVGLAVALILATSSARAEGVHKGTMHAGMIMFDICGAGALGNVIAVSGFSGEVFPLISGALPLVLIPFAFTALVQAAQGSRVVSAVIASEVLSGTAIAASMHPIPLILSVAAGTCVISYLSDPYFWLLQRTTGDSAGEVVKHYSLPLCICGLAALSGAIALQIALGSPP